MSTLVSSQGARCFSSEYFLNQIWTNLDDRLAGSSLPGVKKTGGQARSKKMQQWFGFRKWRKKRAVPTR